MLCCVCSLFCDLLKVNVAIIDYEVKVSPAGISCQYPVAHMEYLETFVGAAQEGARSGGKKKCREEGRRRQKTQGRGGWFIVLQLVPVGCYYLCSTPDCCPD